MKAKIAEVFKSMQGEGIYQGVTQVFVRFYGCNLSCSFCDTKLDSYQEKTVDEILKQVLSYGQVHSVSITGGEPLMQTGFLESLFKALKKENIKIYLETNGVLYSELEKLIGLIDIIAMDFKLPTSTGDKDFWDSHKRFLEIAARKEVFIKAVVGEKTQVGDILQTIEIIKKIKPDTPLVLQPENPREHLLGTKLMFFKMLCKLHGVNAKVLIQKHKQLGVK